MIEREPRRVQQLPRKIEFLFFDAVHGIARDGMPDILRVHAYLVRPPRFQFEQYERKAFVETRKHFIMRHGAPPLVFAHDRHFHAVGRVPADVRRDRAFVVLEYPLAQGEIFARAGLFRDLFGKGKMRAVVFGDDEKPRRVLVDAVHDARTHDAVDAAQRIQPIQERVNERARKIAAARVHREPLLLIDDGDVRVLVNDVEGNIFGRQIERLQSGDLYLDRFPDGERAGGFDGPAVHDDASLIDEFFRRRTGDIHE